MIAADSEIESYLREAHSPIVITMDLFAEKVLNVADKAKVKRVIVCSLADYMPILTRIGAKAKFSKIDLTCLRDKRIIMWDAFLKLGKGEIINPERLYCDNIAVWAHTSGTTGMPKTVLLTNKGYNTVALQYKLCMPSKRQSVFLNIIVPFVVYGMLICIHVPLCMGCMVAIVPKFEADDWNKYFKRYKPNHIAGIPSYYSPILQDKSLKNVDLSGLVSFAAGGDGMNQKLEQEINNFLSSHRSKITLIKGYGMTEICSSAFTTYNHIQRTGSVGIPLVKNSVCIYDNEKQCECSYGEEGEVWISSPALMVGYRADQTATDAQIVTDEKGIKWIRTGDIGYIDEDGFLFLLGRMKRFIFVGPEGLAYKVFPKKIEDVITKDDSVQETCVVSGQTEKGLAPKAYVVLKNSCMVAENEITEELSTLCEKLLPDYLRPFSYEYLKELPHTSIGKIDYQLLEKMALEKETEIID